MASDQLTRRDVGKKGSGYFKPTNKTIAMLDSKPDNVIFVDKSIFFPISS